MTTELPRRLRPSRRQVLGGAAALGAAALLPACGGGGSAAPAPAPAPPPAPASNPQPTPTGPMTAASITVSAGNAGLIAPGFAGLSYEKSMLSQGLFTPGNSNLIALFQRLGPSVLRVGGNSVDRTTWAAQGAGGVAGQVAPSDVKALAAFVKAAGWQCLYGVNLAGAATGATTPALAAAEVADVSQQLGSALFGVEIGNECDLYGNPGHPFEGNWSLNQFISLWQQYRAAILAAAPNVAITGPASAAGEAKWTVPFGQAVTKNQITLLTQHYYRADGQLPTSTAQLLITPDSKLVADLALLSAGASGMGVPFRMSECNSFYNGGASGVSDSYASALWVIDYLFNCAQGGASGVNFHGGGGGPGYTPIANSGATVVGARPEYHGMLLFTLAGQGSLLPTQITAGPLNATAYAVSAQNGLNLIIVNKDATQNLKAAISLPQAIRSAQLLTLTQQTTAGAAPVLSATSGVTIQGATVGADGSFAPQPAYTLQAGGQQLGCYVPALSAVLIQTA